MLLESDSIAGSCQCCKKSDAYTSARTPAAPSILSVSRAFRQWGADACPIQEKIGVLSLEKGCKRFWPLDDGVGTK